MRNEWSLLGEIKPVILFNGLLVLLWLLALAQLYTGRSNGYMLVLTDMYFFWGAFGSVVLLASYAYAGIRRRPTTNLRTVVLLAGLALFVALQGTFAKINTSLRDREIERGVVSAKPLIQAIKAYQVDHAGLAPGSLVELVPKYLQQVPSPGSGAWHYTYVRRSNYSSWPDLQHSQATAWVLRVDMMKNLFTQLTLAYPAIKPVGCKVQRQIDGWVVYTRGLL